MENNFQCTKCDHVDFISRYKTFFENTGVIYKYPNGNQIVCDKCGAEMKTITQEGNFKANIGKYSSMSMVEKKKAIAKRAANHTKKNMDEIKQRDDTFI